MALNRAIHGEFIDINLNEIGCLVVDISYLKKPVRINIFSMGMLKDGLL